MERLDDGKRVETAYLIAVGRGPTKEMAERAIEFIEQGQKEEGLSRQQAWGRFCQAIFGSNEFRYVD
jgi:hypothetical protein